LSEKKKKFFKFDKSFWYTNKNGNFVEVIMNLNNNVIQTNNLSKTFGNIEALKSLNLTVPKHSITGFLGPNGAGKSTTIKLLLGLLKPTSGTGEVFGLDIQKQSTEIRRRVGYLSQDPHFYPEMTAREVLRFTAKFFYTGHKNAIEERIEEMLLMVGLSEKADRNVNGFSGGERQRLGIAQAQINYPDLLILDEPAASLDPMGRQDVLNIMRNLQKKTTIFYSTHILDDVQRVSDRVVILNQGQLIAQGPIEELLSAGRDIVYVITLEGDTLKIRDEIIELPWVSHLAEEPLNNAIQWRIAVSDTDKAKRDLLPILVNCQGITVLNFGRQERELEEVFMQLVGGGNNGN
jgi:ABC-2 type transport system ATP-binding protein